MALPRIIQQVRALFSAFTGSNPDAATPEVGVLPIEKGGTGQNSLIMAVKALGDNLRNTTGNTAPIDSFYVEQWTPDPAVSTDNRPCFLVANARKPNGGDTVGLLDYNFIHNCHQTYATNIDPGAGTSSLRTDVTPSIYRMNGCICVVYE